MTEDFYDLMGVDEDASQDEIKSAFREKVREYHPDLNDDPRAQAQFTTLKEAYDTLGNPSERNAYDRMGHEDYVAKRIQGLPSQDVWSDAASSSSDADSASSATTSTDTSSTGASSSGTSPSTGTTTGRSSSRRSSSSRSSSSRSSSSRTSSSGGSSGRSSSSRSSGSSSGSTASASTSTSTSTSSGTSSSAADGGTGTASGSTRSSSGSTRRTTRSTATSSYGDTNTAAAASGDDHGLIGRLLRIRIGWPGIVVANLLYLAGVTPFLLANLSSLRSFGRALASTEVATIRAGATTAPATPFTTHLYGTEYVAATDVSALAAVFVLGAVGLPFVYGVVVKRTRRASIRWDPTWLYVVCTLGPLAGVGANLAGYAYVGVDVAAFLALPLLSVVALPLSAFVRPFLVRVFFGD